jgi:hypothetical protein
MESDHDDDDDDDDDEEGPGPVTAVPASAPAPAPTESIVDRGLIPFMDDSETADRGRMLICFTFEREGCA